LFKFQRVKTLREQPPFKVVSRNGATTQLLESAVAQRPDMEASK